MMVRKKFDRELYDKYDSPAKSSLIQILTEQGHTISNVKENFYADLESVKDGVTYYSEAEVKRGWKGRWPLSWAEIRIPYRKSRLIKKYKGNVNFYIFDADLKQCWMIRGEQLVEDFVRTVSSANISKGELFFHIPYGEAELIHINKG